jgi:hypothetical protein
MAPIIISKPDSSPRDGPVALSDFAVIASYNWLDEPQPTILVPGMPAIWSPPLEIQALKPDSGTRYVDQNADRMPCSPLEPLLRAVQTHRPGFDLSELDIVCDRRPLRLLHGFMVGDQEAFQFGVEAVGNTTVFTRAERTSRETIAPNTFAGYRASFEEAYTKLHPDAKGSTSHYRIVTYTLGGLKLLVRSGVDAYRPSAVGEHLNEPSGSDYSQEDCTRNMKNLSLNEGPSTSAASTAGELLVIKGGRDVPQAAVLELSTHAHLKPSAIHRKITGLYFSQTPCFVEGSFISTGPRYNVSAQRARFGLVAVNDVTKWTAQWEKQHQDKLKTLVHVLKQIVSGARTLGKPCVVKFDGVGDLRLERAGDEDIPSLSEKWKEVLLRGQQVQPRAYRDAC